MKNKIVTAAALAFALATGTAFAADTNTTAGTPEMKHEEHFKKVDTNGDGAISKDEFHAHGDKKFDEIDTNHDGKLTPDEKKAHHEAMKAKWKARHEAKETGKK